MYRWRKNMSRNKATVFPSFDVKTFYPHSESCEICNRQCLENGTERADISSVEKAMHAFSNLTQEEKLRCLPDLIHYV